MITRLGIIAGLVLYMVGFVGRENMRRAWFAGQGHGRADFDCWGGFWALFTGALRV